MFAAAYRDQRSFCELRGDLKKELLVFSVVGSSVVQQTETLEFLQSTTLPGSWWVESLCHSPAPAQLGPDPGAHVPTQSWTLSVNCPGDLNSGPLVF